MGKTVLLITGGTGGHVFPAISLMKMNAELNYLVLLDHRTEWIVKKQKFKYVKVYSSKINLNLKLPLSILKIILGIIQSLFIIIKYKPDLAIGFGGYTSIPTILAARILNIKTIIHEQNAVMGKTNRILSKFVNYVALTFKETKFARKDSLITGIPVRKKPIKLKRLVSKKKAKRLLVIGGSQGAKVFNSLVPKILSNLKDANRKKIIVSQQIKKNEMRKAMSLYKKINIRFIFKEFFEDIYDEINKADLIISRCGSSTLAEIELFQKYCILFPLPSAMNNHQYYNALEFKKKNNCLIVDENNLNITKLSAVIEDKIFSKRQKSNKYYKIKNKLTLSKLVKEVLI